jgi:hypothetical protein
MSMSPIPTSESPLPEPSLPSMESLSETIPPMSLPDTSGASIEPPPSLPPTKSETPL